MRSQRRRWDRIELGADVLAVDQFGLGAPLGGDRRRFRLAGQAEVVGKGAASAPS